jgi:hypothetical protein
MRIARLYRPLAARAVTLAVALVVFLPLGSIASAGEDAFPFDTLKAGKLDGYYIINQSGPREITDMDHRYSPDPADYKTGPTSFQGILIKKDAVKLVIGGTAYDANLSELVGMKSSSEIDKDKTVYRFSISISKNYVWGGLIFVDDPKKERNLDIYVDLGKCSESVVKSFGQTKGYTVRRLLASQLIDLSPAAK